MAGQAYGVSNVAVEVGSARWLVAGAANPFGKMDCGAVRQIRLAKWTAVRCGRSVWQKWTAVRRCEVPNKGIRPMGDRGSDDIGWLAASGERSIARTAAAVPSRQSREWGWAALPTEAATRG